VRSIIEQQRLSSAATNDANPIEVKRIPWWLANQQQAAIKPKNQWAADLKPQKGPTRNE
jgi:hypothetical protein